MEKKEIAYTLQVRRAKGEWYDAAGFINFPSISELLRRVIQLELNPEEFPDTRVVKNTVTKTTTQEVI